MSKRSDEDQHDEPDAGDAQPRAWTSVETEHLQNCRVFEVNRVGRRSPSTGEVHSFFTIDASDWVNVIALTTADEVVMVRQFRHGSCAITLEIPGGMVDPDESPAQAAARELLEETGYRGAAPERLGVVNPNPALFGNTCHTFLIPDARRVDEIRNDGATEETVLELVPRADIARRLRDGAIDHALVIAAFFWLELARSPERAFV